VYDGGKKIQGRKRHLLVETWGLVLAVLITSARLDDGVAAPLLLSHVTPQDLPRLVTICADQKYHNHALDAWMAMHRTGWRIEVKARPEGIHGFTPLAKLWVIECTNERPIFFTPWLPPLCYTRLQSTPQQLHANSLQYRSIRMSSEISDRTAAPQKMHNPAKYWTFFTTDNFEFWNFVGRSREDLKTQGALSQEAEPAQKTLRTTESAAKQCTSFSTDLGENCLLKHS